MLRQRTLSLFTNFVKPWTRIRSNKYDKDFQPTTPLQAWQYLQPCNINLLDMKKLKTRCFLFQNLRLRKQSLLIYEPSTWPQCRNKHARGSLLYHPIHCRDHSHSHNHLPVLKQHHHIVQLNFASRFTFYSFLLLLLLAADYAPRPKTFQSLENS